MKNDTGLKKKGSRSLLRKHRELLSTLEEPKQGKTDFHETHWERKECFVYRRKWCKPPFLLVILIWPPLRYHCTETNFKLVHCGHLKLEQALKIKMGFANRWTLVKVVIVLSLLGFVDRQNEAT